MFTFSLQQFFVLLAFSQFLSEVVSVNDSSVNDSSKNLVQEANIFKCKCNKNEAISNNECVPAANPIQVWDYIKQRDLTLDVSMFTSVNINPIQCQSGFTKLNLNRTHFVIYTNGLLDNLILVDEAPTHNYCIEHTLTEYGIDVIAEVCEQNPMISICCPVGYVTNFEGNCEFRNDVLFHPPLIGEFAWNGYNFTERNITCDKKEVLNMEVVTQPQFFGASLVSYPIGAQLQWHTIDNVPQYYSNNEYCITVSEQEQQWMYFAHFCVPDKKLEHIETCSNHICVRKCCPYGYIYDESFASCAQYFSHKINYSFIDFENNIIPDPNNLTIVLGLPFCKEVQIIFYLENDTENIKFYSNGSLSTKGLGTYSSLEYCVDGYSANLHDPNATVLNTAFICHKGLTDPCAWRWIVGSVLMFISCIFYILTIVVYAAIEELRSRMIGKCLISQVSALLISYVTLIYLINNNNYSTVNCIIPGTIEHVAILASFFWLNIMCFDMWSNIRSINIATQSIKPTFKKFIQYCIYAWGLPVLIASIRLTIDNLPDDLSQYWLIKSHIGETHCFFSGIYHPLPKWLYLYGPILIILVINLYFFIHVAVVIIKIKKETDRLLKGADSGKSGKNINAKKERALLYLKLFLVMGISWILEIIMWVAVEENDCTFWGVDIINMFQGVFVFLIFVCKKSTLEKIKYRLLPQTPRQRDDYCLTEPDRSREEVNNIVALQGSTETNSIHAL